MPLLRRKPFVRKRPPKNLRDSDQVFYCELTDEVFTEYEEFCERIIQCNSLVWSCAMTGRSELTYTEALVSEMDAHAILKSFPVELKVPSLYLASIAQRTSFNQLVEDVYLYMKDRYFIGEPLEVCLENNTWYECTVLQIYEPQEDAAKKNNVKDAKSPCKFLPPASLYHYEVERFVNYDDVNQVYDADASQVRRKKGSFSKDKLRLFLRQYSVLDARGIWVIQGPILQSFGIQKVKFHHIFTGNPPVFPSSKRNSKNTTKTDNTDKQKNVSNNHSKPSIKGSKPLIKKSRQENIEKYFVSTKDESLRKKSVSKTSQSSVPNNSKKSPRKENVSYSQKQLAKKVKEKYIEVGRKKDYKHKVNGGLTQHTHKTEDRKQKIKEEKKEKALEEKKKKHQEKLKEKAKLKEEKLQLAKFMKEWQRKREDLECEDLKDLPMPAQVKCGIPNALFGEFVVLLEFLHSFDRTLGIKDFFPSGISFELLERSLTETEIAGPLSNLIQMLLSVLFEMQEKEDDELLDTDIPTSVDLDIDDLGNDLTTSEAVRLATSAANWSQLYQGLPLNDVTLDCITLTEILRLHLLASGGRSGEMSAKWRYQQRGGYRNIEDPGLMLRIEHPHILRSLSVKSIFELSIEDKLIVLNCLMNQILTYTSLRGIIDDRCEKIKQTKAELRSFQIADVKCDKEATALRIKVKREAKLKLIKGEETTTGNNSDAETLKKLEIQKQKLQKDIQRKKHETFNSSMNFQLLPLGTDRAHRRFWLFSSLSGLFVEHNEYETGPCLSQPTPHNPLSRGDTVTYIKTLFEEECHNGSDKENDGSDMDISRTYSSPNKKMLSEKNATLELSNSTWSENKVTPLPHSPETDVPQTERWVCTANEFCAVHKSSNKPCHWSFFAQEDDFSRLLECLNKRGIREGQLRTVLVQEEEKIRESINRCPIHKLNPSQSEHTEQRKSSRNNPVYKLQDTHLGFTPGTPIAEILRRSLRDLILKLEEKISDGCLGSLKVKDPDAWREALRNDGYDKQCDKLEWGGSNRNSDEHERSKKNKVNIGQEKHQTPCNFDIKCDEMKSDTTDLEIRQSRVVKNPTSNIPLQKINSDLSIGPGSDCSELSYQDPGRMLDDGVMNAQESPPQHPSVKPLASAILQVAQSVDTRYLKKPLGQEDSKADADTDRNTTQLERWEISLMASTSFSQLFVHLLTLENSLLWSRSTLNASCKLCRRKGDGDKMLLCDGCNKGHHTYCLKPKLSHVPRGSWYCPTCRIENKAPAKRKREMMSRRVDRENGNISYVERSDSEESDDDDDDDDDDMPEKKERKSFDHNNICDICGLDGDLILCSLCPLAFHVVCIIPPLKNPPRSSWVCRECRPIKESKVAKDTVDQDLDVSSVRQRRCCTSATIAKIARFAKRLRSHSWDDEDGADETTPSRRSSRRSNGPANDLPLNNAVLQDILAEIMRHKDAWPFLRPVPKAKVPDYHLIIKRPMDFGTMKYKLNMIEYMNNNEFIADALLVFENCQMYNQVDAVEYKCGLRLSRYFKKRCKEMGLEIKEAEIKSQPKRPRINI